METITTEQYIDYTLDVRDGRGRPKEYDGEAAVAVSDETVATAAMTDRTTLRVTSVAPGDCRVTVQVDVKEGDEVETRTGIAEVHVDQDPRTSERTFTMNAGTPTDKAV